MSRMILYHPKKIKQRITGSLNKGRLMWYAEDGVNARRCDDIDRGPEEMGENMSIREGKRRMSWRSEDS